MVHCPCLKLFCLCQTQGLNLEVPGKVCGKTKIETQDTRASSQGVQLNHLD